MPGYTGLARNVLAIMQIDGLRKMLTAIPPHGVFRGYDGELIRVLERGEEGGKGGNGALEERMGEGGGTS